MTKDAKKAALDAALSQIEKSFGKGSIMRMGEHEHAHIETVSSGSISIDLALGGGYPKGRIIEIYGPESSGKTTICLHAAAEFQKAGGTVAFIDAEHALDPEYAKKVGVNIDELLLSQPDSGEQALDIVEALVRSGGVDRRRDGRPKHGTTSTTNESSTQKTNRCRLKNGNIHHLHQSDQNEDRSNVWKSGNHYRRKCFEILFFCSTGDSKGYKNGSRYRNR